MILLTAVKAFFMNYPKIFGFFYVLQGKGPAVYNKCHFEIGIATSYRRAVPLSLCAYQICEKAIGSLMQGSLSSTETH